MVNYIYVLSGMPGNKERPVGQKIGFVLQILRDQLNKEVSPSVKAYAEFDVDIPDIKDFENCTALFEEALKRDQIDPDSIEGFYYTAAHDTDTTPPTPIQIMWVED